MVNAQAVRPRLSALNATWQAVGPAQIQSAAYGKISGRVSSIAVDPSDQSGNTVYVGTTGGGVWKSTNAAGPAESVTFQPLTDNLPVFSGNAGSTGVASLSIGAVSVQSGGIVLAGTGDPNDASDSYYGEGILRSSDGGQTWTLIPGSQDGVVGQHSFAGLGFAEFAWSTVNPGLVVAAVSQSAEGSMVNAPTKNSVMGLYASQDGGVTWQMATISDGANTVLTPLSGGANLGGVAATSVVWNGVRQRFYAAVRYHGYYESTDGMAWKRLAQQPGTGLTSIACPALTGATVSVSCPIFRGTLAAQPVTGDLFAITSDRHNVDQGLYQDVCAKTGSGCSSSTVTFANRLASSALEVGGGSAVIPQADYSMSLAAQPFATDTVLFVGSGDLFRCSIAGGCSLRNTTNATNGCGAPAKVAPGQHAIAAPGNSGLVFVGNDSGLWRSLDDVAEQGSPCSLDDASHFQNLNGGLGSLAEVVSLAQDPNAVANVLAGLGASGTVSSAGGTGSAWLQVSAGEGGTVAIDQSDPRLWYISTAGGVSLRSCSLGASCGVADFAGSPTIGALQTSSDASVVDAPWILDPGLSSSVLVGTCRVWRGAAGSGAGWSSANQLSPTLGGPQNASCDPTTNSFVRSLAAGGVGVYAGAAQSSGSPVLYAGMAGLVDGGGAFPGHIFSTAHADAASASARWVDLTTSPVTNDALNSGRFNPGGFDVSSVVADPHDATGKTVYATVMGFGGGGISVSHLYGSTDGGAHWLNLSSNLPNAPANAALVDPNDANTVYVALDTGVYVTTQIATCATSNCWSVYGLSLPNSPVTQLAAGGGLATGDGRFGLLRAGTYGRGIWQIPLLTAAAPVRAAVTLSRTTVSFADQPMNSVSAAQTVMVTNTGAAPLSVSRILAGGDFQTTDTCVGTTIAINGSCTVSVQFLPASQGMRSGLLTIYGNVSGGQATATLIGNGTAPGNLVLTPLALNFPTTVVNATSAAQNVTISNTGGSTVTLSGTTISGDFRVLNNTCGASLGAGTGCTIAVVFSPTASGSRNGNLVVPSGNGTLTVPLTGLATTPATDALAPTVLAFGEQVMGTTSVAQAVTLTNAGDVSLRLVSAQIASGDFIAVNGCGATLNAHSACSIAVSYVPKSQGSGQGVLVISDEFRSQTVSLSGTGLAPAGVSLSPSGSVALPSTSVGARSAVQSVTLTNNGGVPLVMEGVAVSGDFASASGGSCGAVLAVSASCTIAIAFQPSAAGTRTGVLTITDNAPSSPQTLALTGVGVDFTLIADGSTSATIANGKSATFPLLLQSATGITGTATFSCTAVPVNATCVVSPGSASLGSTTLITVTVLTGVATTISEQMHGILPGEYVVSIACAGLLPLGLMVRRKRRVASLLGLLIVLCVGGLGGCGAGRMIPATVDAPPPGSAQTPSGTYALTVSATSTGLTRSMTLNLTVQ